MARKKRGTKRAPLPVSERTVRMGRQRRLVLPAEICDAVGLREGDELEAVKVARGHLAFEVRRRDELIREMQRRWAKLAKGRSLADELIAERREEARREREEG